MTKLLKYLLNIISLARDAYRLASAQSGSMTNASVARRKTWLHRGFQLAGKNNDEAMRASFVFQMAKVEYLYLKPKGKLKKISIELTNDLRSLQSSNNRIVKAQAYLLVGMLSHYNFALKMYQTEKHSIGQLETLNQLQELKSNISDQVLLNACHLAKETGQTLAAVTDLSKVTKDAVNFYGMQRIGSYYYMPAGQDIWIGEPLMRLKASEVKKVLVKHCKVLSNTWLSRHSIQNRLEQKIASISLHHQLLCEEKHLICTCSDRKVCTAGMQEYLQTSIHLFELQCLNKFNHQNVEQNIEKLIAVFTPTVSIYVQTQHKLTGEHIVIFRQSVNSCDTVRQ